MLVSEVKRWHYFISWDNPDPADSRTMLSALNSLGKVTTLQTKTSVALAPKSATTWQQVRAAIEQNLHSKRGNAFYVNLRSSLGFHIGKATGRKWKRV